VWFWGSQNSGVFVYAQRAVFIFMNDELHGISALAKIGAKFIDLI